MYGKIVNGTVYFNSEGAIQLFSNCFKSKFTEPLIANRQKANSQTKLEEYTQYQKLMNRLSVQAAIARTDRLHTDKELTEQKKQMIRDAVADEDLRECSFQPKTNAQYISMDLTG